MQIGSLVYWVNGDRICHGEVVAANCRKMTTDGKPDQIVVDYDGMFHLRGNGNGWEKWYDTAVDAYRAGVEAVNKRTLGCTQAMSCLIDDLQSITEGEERKRE
jgi:hypothetical protein